MSKRKSSIQTSASSKSQQLVGGRQIQLARIQTPTDFLEEPILTRQIRPLQTRQLQQVLISLSPDIDDQELSHILKRIEKTIIPDYQEFFITFMRKLIRNKSIPINIIRNEDFRNFLFFSLYSLIEKYKNEDRPYFSTISQPNDVLEHSILNVIFKTLSQSLKIKKERIFNLIDDYVRTLRTGKHLQSGNFGFRRKIMSFFEKEGPLTKLPENEKKKLMKDDNFLNYFYMLVYQNNIPLQNRYINRYKLISFLLTKLLEGNQSFQIMSDDRRISLQGAGGGGFSTQGIQIMNSVSKK